MKDKKIKNAIKELPLKLGIGSLAALMCIGEGVIGIFLGVAGGHGRLTVGKASRILNNNEGIFWDYYEELRDIHKNNLRVILHRLREKGLIEKNDKEFKLTKLGLKYFKAINKGNSKEKWDNKWRIVMFDIPEVIKNKREWLRTQLYIYDYRPIQRSVFIGKMPMKEEFFREINDKGLRSFVRLLVVGEIDDEKFLDYFDNI